MSNSRKILLPCGRMVQGHPMQGNPVVDKATKQPKLNVLGQQIISYYFALAIPKQGEQGDKGWQQTPWGNQIVQAGVEGWPNGEHQAPAFAWKVVDGDSPVPDQNGKPWNQKEGFPGHWVLKISTSLAPTPCYHAGQYQAHQVIQDPKELKCGDYVRAEIEVVGNSPSQTPGVYLNPVQVELSRAGVQIISASVPDANEAFGGSQAQLPQNGLYDNSVQNPASMQQPQQQQVQQQVQQQQVQQQPQQQQVQQQPQQQPVQQQGGYQQPVQQQGGYQQPVQQQGGYQQPVQQPAQGFEQAPQNFLNNQ